MSYFLSLYLNLCYDLTVQLNVERPATLFESRQPRFSMVRCKEAKISQVINSALRPVTPPALKNKVKIMTENKPVNCHSISAINVKCCVKFKDAKSMRNAQTQITDHFYIGLI